MTFTIYVRDQGPICYETDVFNDEQMLDALPQHLSTSDLRWYWQSVRVKPIADRSKIRDLSPERLLTLLTPDNATSLLDDFREVDIDGDGRYIVLFGADGDTGLLLLESARLRPALEDFLEREEGPIRIIMIQINDTPRQYIFVPHAPIEPVRRLLVSWGIDRSYKHKRRPYKQLYLATLEAQLESIVALASGKL